MEFFAASVLTLLLWWVINRQMRSIAVLSTCTATSLLRFPALVPLLRSGGHLATQADAMRRGCVGLVSWTSRWPLRGSRTSHYVANACSHVLEDEVFAALAFVGLIAFCASALLLQVRRVRIVFVAYMTAVVLVNAMYVRGDCVKLVARTSPVPFDPSFLSDGFIASIDDVCVHVLRAVCGCALYALVA